MFTVRRTAGSSGEYLRYPGRSGIPFSFVLLFSALWLAGCQHDGGERPALTLEEAKQVTASFGGRSFTPPPRTVTDVTAILSKQAQDDLELVKEARTLADTPPPVTTDAGDLATFHIKRAEAASKLGRSGQEIADFRLALQNAGKVHNIDIMDEASYRLALARCSPAVSPRRLPIGNSR